MRQQDRCRIYTVGHPNASVKEADTAGEALLVAATGDAVGKLTADHPYYAKAVIPGGLYRCSENDILTFGAMRLW